MYNAVFWYTEILQPALKPKSFSIKLSDPNLVFMSNFFKGKVISLISHALLLNTSVSGVTYRY